MNPWAIVGGSALSAIGGVLGSNSAADAQEEASKRALREQQRTLGIQLGLLEPSRYLGHQAMGDLASLYGYGMAPYASASQLNQPTMDASAFIKAMDRGLSFDQVRQLGRLGALNEAEIAKLTKAGLTPEQIQQLSAIPGSVQGGGGQTAPGSPSLSRFWASPDYNFRRDEGMRGLEQSAAARGGAFSGNALRGLNEYNSNLASGEFGNYFNRLATLAGFGQVATGQAGNAVGNAGNNMANLNLQQGDARASGIMNGVNAITGSVNNGLNLWAILQGMGKT
jgi:hypothetical protein